MKLHDYEKIVVMYFAFWEEKSMNKTKFESDFKI